MPNSFLIAGGDSDSRYRAAIKIIKQRLKGNPWQEKNNPDFFLIDPISDIGIEEIRQLQKSLNLKPFSHPLKVALILKAESLTAEAQNALLKTLEEPPVNSLIFLATFDSALLIPTLVSRCQITQLPVTSQISLSVNETKKGLETFNKLLNSSIGKRWQILEELGIYQDRQKAIDWLEETIFFARKLLVDEVLKENPSKLLLSSFLNLLVSLIRAKSYLRANTNVRLTLENCFLET